MAAPSRPSLQAKEIVMATVKRPASTEQITLDVYEVTLEEGEIEELRADPEAFTRQLMGDDHVINAVHLSKNIATDDDCVDLQLMHTPTGPTASSHFWECIHRQ
jgi:hypothetical protein